MDYNFYDKDVRFKPMSQLRDPAFCGELAWFLAEWRLSSDAIVDRICDEVYLRHRGRVLDERGAPLGLKAYDVEHCFGADPGRYVRNFLRRTHRPGQLRLIKPLVRRLAWMDCARTIWLGRHGLLDR